MKSYDTIEGITSYLDDLEGLHRLIRDRSEAYHDAKVRLHDFVICGRWVVDSNGHFGRVTVELPSLVESSISIELAKVLSVAEIRHVLPRTTTRYSYDSSSLPPTSVRCMECGKKWTIDDADDAVDVGSSSTIPLRDYLDQPLKVVLDKVKETPTIVMVVHADPALHNTKYIDKTPLADDPKRCVNERGWIAADPKHVIVEGDELAVARREYFHKRCYTLQLARTERAKFQQTFSNAGMPDAVLDAIPNEYWGSSDPASPPWFIARLPWGDVKIGWRKRVISIDWSQTKKDLLKLFEEENVTKDSFGIHAYGHEKAVEYLKKIAGAFV